MLAGILYLVLLFLHTFSYNEFRMYSFWIYKLYNPILLIIDGLSNNYDNLDRVVFDVTKILKHMGFSGPVFF